MKYLRRGTTVKISGLLEREASLAEGIRRLRAGEVIRKPGFDGEYGKIELF